MVSECPWYSQLIDFLNTDAWDNPRQFDKFKDVICAEIVKLYKLLIEYQLQSFAVNRALLIARNTIGWDDWKRKVDKIKTVEQELMQYIKTYNKIEFKNKFNKLLQDQNSVLRDIYDIGLKHYGLERQHYKAEVIQKFKLDPTEMNLDTYNDHINRLEKLETGTGQGVLKPSAL